MSDFIFLNPTYIFELELHVQFFCEIQIFEQFAVKTYRRDCNETSLENFQTMWDRMFFQSRYFAYLLWRIKMLHTINHWKYPGKNMNNNQKKSANGRWSQSGPFFAIDYHQWKWSCSSAGGILVVFWIYYWCSRMCLLLYLLFRFVCIYADKCTE